MHHDPCAGDSEQDRLDALATLQILNSERLPEYDDLVETLATIFDAPMAFISIVGKDDLWFKAKIGIDVDGTPRKGTFCDQAILSRELMVVPDALEDPASAIRASLPVHPTHAFMQVCRCAWMARISLGHCALSIPDHGSQAKHSSANCSVWDRSS